MGKRANGEGTVYQRKDKLCFIKLLDEILCHLELFAEAMERAGDLICHIPLFMPLLDGVNAKNTASFVEMYSEARF